MGMKQLKEDDLKSLLLIRHFEALLLALFAQGAVKGTTHACLGQEYIAVALKALLAPNDFVLSNHRCHGHYLARFNDPAGLLAEILGREGAVCNGVGGSQHIYRPGFLSTGIQGENVGVSLGIGLHQKKLGQQGIVLVYIGDGTWGQGIVYEALNIMSLLSLPIILLVENNGIAQTTLLQKNMAGDIEGRARAFGVDYHKVRGYILEDLREELSPYFSRVRESNRPCVIECVTFRHGPHSAGKDTRSEALMDQARAHDWYNAYRQMDPVFFDRIENDVKEQLKQLHLSITDAPLTHVRRDNV